ncbi:hypothetical protein Y032_0002g656 [Ancylostoma ceylanicum]|uniref:Oligomycin sensitivity conferral protein n=1 Tax=Ancylostoma ceylanicum TaxID=53326 RepID=A0A016W0T3_9BILA|nr:hypothetical protein Y032_0002g656 [Ancylostoma ceylanicum]
MRSSLLYSHLFGSYFSKFHGYRMAQMLKRSFSMSATAFSGLVKAPVADFVLDPTLKGLKKKQAVLAVAQKLGLSKESTNFLGLLAENGRLSKLEAVVASYEHIMRAHRGELFVQVLRCLILLYFLSISSFCYQKFRSHRLNHSANPTNPHLATPYIRLATFSNAVDMLTSPPKSRHKLQMAKSGQKLNVTYTVKPSIMGGLVVTIGDKYVDLSIASRIKKLKETLVASV